nr:glycosyltransferase family 2 protein [Ralstonia sp. ASV6]
MTPTFNRAYTLPRLYESLVRQTSRDFEWLVVDDGSEDETGELISRLAKNKAVRIRYIAQANAGKHIALNTGVQQAHGDMILIVDSDDALVDGAIQQIKDRLTEHMREDLSGLCFRKALFDGKLLGRVIKADAMKLNPTEASKMFKGDLAYVFKRSTMASNPFPQIPGEKFVPELYVWNKIADMGCIVFFPEDVIYRCEYLPDGYTHNFMSTLKKNPKGFLLFYASQISRETSVLLKLKYSIRWLQCLYYSAAKSFHRAETSEPLHSSDTLN